jgi:hypothetical protein
VRVYPVPPKADETERPPKKHPLPKQIIVFDTETRVDATQRLTFGSFRVYIEGECLEEGIFHAPDLSKNELAVLRRYVRTHRPNTHSKGVRKLNLTPLPTFLRELFRDTYKARCLLVGFNLPFDLSRIAYDFTNARREYAGGFSLSIWAGGKGKNPKKPNANRPNVAVKHIDSKRALIGFTSRMKLDSEDKIPEGSKVGKAEEGYNFRGHFLDLRTLAFALTDRGHSLESACKSFGVEHGKKKTGSHGKITSKYIDYNRRDVLATSELAFKLLEEYDKHPISLQPTKAFSAATIGKSYLKDMGVVPVLTRQPRFPKRFLGFAQSAFFGGRTSAHIRKTVVPVVYTDFLSMYPTVNSLMGLWKFVTSREIKVVRSQKENILRFLKKFIHNSNELFNPLTWKQMPAFVRLIPDGDILPSRSKYSLESNDWQVAINYLYAGSEKAKDALWFSLPDVVASVLLTGRIPRIIDAFRIKHSGLLKDLRPIRLRSAVNVDPRTQDFFKVAIEQRKLLSKRKDLVPAERERLDAALKVLANAASYGIYAEMIRHESEIKVRVTCRGIDPGPFTCNVANPENPGEYCFPPFASLITGAARLMLALLERSVTSLGGTYAMEDTDSMAIVATRTGGLVACPGGSERSFDGSEAIKALSWKQVEAISKRFGQLNPYNRKAIHGSILKIESDNEDLKSKTPRQIYCFAISAKRYVLFVKDSNGEPVLLRQEDNNDKDRWSEHGLGHLLNPTDLEDEDREWIAQIWLSITRRAFGLTTVPLAFNDYPAIGRLSVSSWHVMKSLTNLNRGKSYRRKIKPFNFLMSCQVREFGHPIGVNAETFHLISPYETNPRKWLKQDWIDEHSKDSYGITTTGHHGSRHTARVKTYGEVINQYEFHPESKCQDTSGNPCDKQTVGLLNRRHIKIEHIKYIGKESNNLEEVEKGEIHDSKSVYTEYPDIRRDEWATKVVPALKRLKLKYLVAESGMSRRAIIDIRGGRSRPHVRNQMLLISIARKRRKQD